MELVKNIKQAKILKYVFFALLGTILLAISSKIKIPFYPVPMTMQTLVVLLIGVMFWLETWYRYNLIIFVRRYNWTCLYLQELQKRELV